MIAEGSIEIVGARCLGPSLSGDVDFWGSEVSLRPAIRIKIVVPYQYCNWAFLNYSVSHISRRGKR